MSVNDDSIAQEERRRTERGPLAGRVTVEMAPEPIVGPGQNISEEGVFFVAETSLRVRVKIDGEERWLDGEVVRVQSMGEGRVGMAIKFV